jgi:hypothetical protein
LVGFPELFGELRKHVILIFGSARIKSEGQAFSHHAPLEINGRGGDRLDKILTGYSYYRDMHTRDRALSGSAAARDDRDPVGAELCVLGAPSAGRVIATVDDLCTIDRADDVYFAQIHTRPVRR